MQWMLSGSEIIDVETRRVIARDVGILDAITIIEAVRKYCESWEYRPAMSLREFDFATLPRMTTSIDQETVRETALRIAYELDQYKERETLVSGALRERADV